jgi:hypothetical protein
MKIQLLAGIVLLTSLGALARSSQPLFIAPLYVEYTSVSADEFTNEVKELRRRIGEAPNVKVGFSAFLNIRFEDRIDLNTPLSAEAIQPTMTELEMIVNRARSNGLPVHISIASGFLHGYNALREAAIRADVRNAQWFSDGWISNPEEIGRSREIPRSAWITLSPYAQPLRQRMEESMRILGEHFAGAMEQNPETLHSISGDTEVELSFARNLDSQGRPRTGGEVLLGDYSPFTVAEFRDWLRSTRYAGDASPATDDNHDGHTFNQDFRQQFRTWRLRYFDDSGPIPYERYRAVTEKLPKSGPNFIEGGFDAPRRAAPGNPFWKAWQDFRIRSVANYVHDFAEWMTAGSRIPASRYYSHQIPADYLFGGKDTTRLGTSASPLETAWIPGIGSAGVTVFDTYDGKSHSKTSNSAMFSRLEQSGSNWGILEYSPSVPAVADENYYLEELRMLSSFHPSIIAPFAWTNDRQHEPYRIQNTAYERALRKFVEEAGSDIHR